MHGRRQALDAALAAKLGAETQLAAVQNELACVRSQESQAQLAAEALKEKLAVAKSVEGQLREKVQATQEVADKEKARAERLALDLDTARDRSAAALSKSKGEQVR